MFRVNAAYVGGTECVSRMDSRRTTSSAGTVTAARPADAVEITSRVSVSDARIAAIRQEIANGTYLTEHKLDVAAEQLVRAARAAPAARDCVISLSPAFPRCGTAERCSASLCRNYNQPRVRTSREQL